MVSFQLPAVHKLRLYDAKLQWTVHNRNVCFALYDGYRRADSLKDNLSANALRHVQSDPKKVVLCLF